MAKLRISGPLTVISKYWSSQLPSTTRRPSRTRVCRLGAKVPARANNWGARPGSSSLNRAEIIVIRSTAPATLLNHSTSLGVTIPTVYHSFRCGGKVLWLCRQARLRTGMIRHLHAAEDFSWFLAKQQDDRHHMHKVERHLMNSFPP
jgi:hypothetical protein